jgi:hypothetical protein
MKSRNLCEFIFCRKAWTVLIERANMNGGGQAWQLHFCDEHAAPYQSGTDPYEGRAVTITPRAK